MESELLGAPRVNIRMPDGSFHGIVLILFRCHGGILLRDAALPGHRKMSWSTVSMVLLEHFEHSLLCDFSKKEAFVRG